MRPVIGITTGFQTTGDAEAPTGRIYLPSDYSDAVLTAGGLPLPLPTSRDAKSALIDELLARVDGLLFTGGPDVDPSHYGEARHPQTQVMHPRRQQFELELFRRADAAHKPILAICLGFQIAHVARGGRLVQHIEDVDLTPRIAHRRSDDQSAFHSMQLVADSRLAAVVAAPGAPPMHEIEVNSRHHQGVLATQGGRGLRPVGHSPDGLLEASEDMDGRFLLAVQWHPENLTDRPEHLRLFEALVQQAR
jgi:putative glutamine amidotransferase